jgi:glycosyltransferase involved in cell wall biosynthesis
MQKRIKVLFFISSLEGGGAERVMVDILRHIDMSRIETLLVLLYPFERSPYKHFLPADVKILVVGRRSDALFHKFKQFVKFIITVHNEKPHVILSMLTHNNLVAILAGKLFGTKVIVCEHNTLGEVIKTAEGKKILGIPVAPLVKILYRFTDQIVAVSEGIKSNLIEEFTIPAHKIEVVYNPVDLDRIGELSGMPPEQPFSEERGSTVIAMGRLVKQKGFDTLIMAFGRVVQEIDARLIIAGEGPEREYLQGLAGELGIAGKVFFVGFQKNPFNLLSRADVFVLSSTYEGLPMAILESMACGIPVVSTDCWSGPRELLQNGRCGLLVPVGDVNALSEAIVRLLKDRELRENISRLGKERVKDFSHEIIIKQYEEIVYDAVTR